MRYRFVDRIVAVDVAAGTIRTCKVFSRTEDYLDGTFRPEGDVPASLLLETLTQAGATLLAARTRYDGHGILLKVPRAAFHATVRAGDRLTVEAVIRGLADADAAEGGSPGASMADVTARGLVDGVVVAEADLLFLCISGAWSFGPAHVRKMAELLELIGAADARP
jgi:3-hydroxymyristoyl/3-hydroxydecanoyl-(acyl carrier protein) dehydratase